MVLRTRVLNLFQNFFHFITHRILIRNASEFRDNMKGDSMVYIDTCRDTISFADEIFIFVAVDNNQREQRKKEQRQGTRNKYIVVTRSMAIMPIMA